MSETALLDAIRAVPRDRAAREVYADWLEDRGDCRAACIRAHLAVTEVTPDHPVRWEREEVLGRARLGLDPEWLAIVDPRPPLARSCDCFEMYGRSKNGNPRWRDSSLHDDIQDTTSDAWKRICDQIETGIEKEETELDFRGAQVVTLPRSIGRLTTLRRLNLYASYIARVPRELGLLPELTKLEPYTLYNLHYYPYELARAPQLRLSTVSTRALYGNFKFRPPFPLLAPRDEPMPPRPCSVCDAPFEDRGRHRYWTSRRVASDVMPLLINACSAACLANALPPSDGYVAKPHRGGPNVQQPAAH
jgi:uncharacterized protein (TIGR02996 family)